MVETPSTLNNVEVITNVEIMVGNSSYFLVLPFGPTERICCSFEGCSVPLYEFIFTRLRVRLPFSDFEVAVINRLRVAPLQLHPGAQAYMEVFQLYAERKSWEPKLDLFYMAYTSQDDA